MITRHRVLAAAAAMAVSAASLAAAPSPAELAIKYRQSVLIVMAWNMGPMAAAVQGKAPYDKASFARAAARVASVAPLLAEGFPAGSYLPGKTEAKEEIWSNRAEFDGLLKKLATQSAALAELAQGGDFAQLKPAFTELGKVCKSCHDKFKTKDD